jgi:hypothetical protein
MKKAIGLVALIISISLNAQDINTPMKKLIEKTQGSENNSLSSLMDVDLKIICSMPAKNDYKKISQIITGLSNNYIKSIDSIDYSYIKKRDTLVVKIYSQDYAYQSCNCYKLGLDKNIGNDTLVLYRVYYDMKMKSIIEDYFGFNNRKFDFKITEKKVNDNGKINRILISKTYHN